MSPRPKFFNVKLFSRGKPYRNAGYAISSNNSKCLKKDRVLQRRWRPKITQAIVYMVCKDCQPFSIVEHIGFNKLMKTLAPHYKVPSRITIKRLTNNKFDVIAAIMRQN